AESRLALAQRGGRGAQLGGLLLEGGTACLELGVARREHRLGGGTAAELRGEEREADGGAARRRDAERRPRRAAQFENGDAGAQQGEREKRNADEAQAMIAVPAEAVDAQAMQPHFPTLDAPRAAALDRPAPGWRRSHAPALDEG